MNKKLLLRYVLLCLPFAVGSVVYSFGVVNIVSSLLFFVGGYVAIKNIFDYRKVRKNINIVNARKNVFVDNRLDNDVDSIQKVKVYEKSNNNTYKSYDCIPGLKRTRRYGKVRRRVKY